jgi:hypothetical protein
VVPLVIVDDSKSFYLAVVIEDPKHFHDFFVVDVEIHKHQSKLFHFENPLWSYMKITNVLL